MVKARMGPPKGTGRIPLRDKSAKSGSQGSIAAFSGPFSSENLRGIGGQFTTSPRNLCTARLVGGAEWIRTPETLLDWMGGVRHEFGALFDQAKKQTLW